MSIKSSNLAKDYLQNAQNFIWAAEQLNIKAPQNTAEGMFTAENPIYFLMGHAAELLLKAVLAKNNVPMKDLQYECGHDLEGLILKFREYQIPLNDQFLFGAECISEAFRKHDHRYARSFAGFSIEDHQKWLKGELTEKECREYGLVVRSGANINQFLKGLNEQSKIIIDFMKESRAA